MNTNQIPYQWFVAIIGLFLFDLCSVSLWEKQICCALLCAYIFYLFRADSLLHLVFITTLLCCESLLWYGNFWIQLPLLMAIAIIAYYSQVVLYNITLQRFICIILFTIGKVLLVEYTLLGLPIHIPYTMTQITGNIILLWLFLFEIKMIEKWQGKQGNRSLI
jgi:hypothetical protein